MNKAELVEAVAKTTGLSKAQAESALNATLHAIQASLAKGQHVSLVGFGTFAVAKRAARKGKNPRTGEPIKIPARKVARFKPGKALATVVNTGKVPKAKK
ncbi:MAG: HU family DNA-binding protein [Bacteroidota bacterium]|nr:HU family DNA-binding protein [Candidatus Kapabacteria bacterium]MCS7302019.1 HU family DNA-binding protein [Candidatus Kapabacteria bacterium]MCX7936819.1 HU family DNA-binding protein [Chlorobiota bacterium]MDW8074538.1 HU family DNA-binding protein [Bacteroidota bacterium]MDW8270986.1 HU family DNA-binding protein [Bacteroidota bacterium]